MEWMANIKQWTGMRYEDHVRLAQDREPWRMMTMMMMMMMMTTATATATTTTTTTTIYIIIIYCRPISLSFFAPTLLTRL